MTKETRGFIEAAITSRVLGEPMSHFIQHTYYKDLIPEERRISLYNRAVEIYKSSPSLEKAMDVINLID